MISSLQVRMSLERGVEIVDIGLVMFVVMDGHGAPIDVGLQISSAVG
jgi:hypothetical protein